MKKILAACAALAVLASFASSPSAQPRVVPWEITGYKVHEDTLGRFTADSVVTTQVISIDGARGFVVYAISSGTDTITCVPQTRMSGSSVWSGAGGATAIMGAYAAVTGGLNLTTAGKTSITCYGTPNDQTPGGTPQPFLTGDIRFRLKSADARRYDTAALATLAPTGTITVFVRVFK